MSEHTVICKAVSGYDDAAALRAAVEDIFKACPCTAALHEGVRVLLKPNLIGKHRPEAAATTHPAVLKAVIEACCARGVKAADITVADSSGGVYNPGSMKSIYATSGLTAVCAETGAQLYIACEATPRKTDGKLVHEFNLIMPVHETDFIINLPKFKTHVMTGFTGATKNLFGTIPGLQKAELHMRFPKKEDFGNMLVDLHDCVAPNLSIVDGIVGMEGDGPSGGNARNIGVLLGGEDTYTLDLVGCRMVGLAPAQIPYLSAAIARGICAPQLDESLLTGDVQAAQPIADYKMPSSYTSGGDGNTDFGAQTPGLIRWAMPWVQRQIAPHPKVNRNVCIGCGKCAEICPAHTITVTDKKAYIAPKACIRCFCCHEMCPVKAIEVKRFGAFKL